MLITVGSDKGSPGATTLTAALGLVWGGKRVVTEADPRGSDLPFRMARVDGSPLQASPSIVDLAIETRAGSPAPTLERFAQETAVGVAVIAGEMSARSNAKLAPHLPGIAQAAARWDGLMVADLGCLQANNPAIALARAAHVVLLVTRPNFEGLGHLRDRIEELTELVGDPHRSMTSVGVVVRTSSAGGGPDIARTKRLLDSIGSPAPVVGLFADDEAGARLLWDGRAGKKLMKSRLVTSAAEIASEVRRVWPQDGIHQPAVDLPNTVIG